MEECLPNDDLIRDLCTQCDSSMCSNVESISEPSSPSNEGKLSLVAMNKFYIFAED